MALTSGLGGASTRSSVFTPRAIHSPSSVGLQYQAVTTARGPSPAPAPRSRSTGILCPESHIDFWSPLLKLLAKALFTRSFPTPSWSEPIRSLLPGLRPHSYSLQSWTDSLRHSLSRVHSWSVYTDASWRAIHPPPAPSLVGMQGTHEGRGALFLSADSPNWCSSIAAVRFDIPPTLHALGGTAHVAELLAIHTGLHLLHTLNLRGTVYSDCLVAVKKVTRRWTPGRAFQDASHPHYRLPGPSLRVDRYPMDQRTPGTFGNLPLLLDPAAVGNLRSGRLNQELGDRDPPALTCSFPTNTPDPLSRPSSHDHPARHLAMGIMSVLLRSGISASCSAITGFVLTG